MIALDLAPTDRQLRQFGALGAVLLSAAAVAASRGAWWFTGLAEGSRPATAVGLAAAAALVAVLAAVAPRALRPPYVVLTVVAFPIGVVVSTALLVAVFFLVFTPTGLLLRALNRDPLRRRHGPGTATYWTDAAPRRPKERYFRQY